MKTLPLFVTAFVIAACGGTRTVHDGHGDPAGTAAGTGVLHIHATWTEPWCGGAHPEPGEWPLTRPWSGRMYVRPARPDSTGRFAMNELAVPIFDSIKMDGTGHGWLTLPAGTYLIMERDRTDRARHDRLLREHAGPTMHTAAIDTACMRRWLHGPFPVHAITADDTLHMDLPLHGQCPWYATPCVAYFGPLPP